MGGNMKRFTQLCTATSATLAASCAQPETTHQNIGPPPAECELVPVMLEEFDTLSVAPWKLENWLLPTARWTAHTPWNGDFGDADFIDPGPDGPFSVKDGILSITARKDENGNWTSGLLAAADKTGAGTGARYGYFEARMKLPPGPGTWPAFWLGVLEPVPGTDADLEIDVMEYYGRKTTEYGITVHAWYEDESKYWNKDKFPKVPAGSLVDDFNTYGVDVSPQALVFYLNREEVWRLPAPEELTKPLYPLVNLALGAGWPIDKTPNPSVLLVDYVHVYERSAGPPEGCRPGPPRD